MKAPEWVLLQHERYYYVLWLRAKKSDEEKDELASFHVESDWQYIACPYLVD